MSLRLGMIISQDCVGKRLDHFKQKYHYKFLVVENKGFKTSQLEPDEILVEPTGNYDDSETGIGSYPYYMKDPKLFYSKIKGENIGLYNFFIKEANARNKEYYNNAELWKKIILEMKEEYHFAKVGLFYFGGYTQTKDINFPTFSRRVCSVNTLTPEDLMKIEENEILFFA